MGAKNTRPRGSFADVKELEYISALHQTGKNELRIDGSIHAIDIVHFLESRYGIKATVEEVRERILSAFGQCARSREASIRPDQNDVTICENIVPDNDEMTVSDGGCIKNEEGRLDLTQILALLLVPLLLKAERSLVQEKQKQFELHSAPPTLVSDRENGEEKMTAGHPEDTLRNISLHESPPCFAMKGDKRPPDADLIDNVLRMMMHDATGDPNPRPLTKDLVRQLLCFYGEEEIAEDERLLDEMMMAATSSIPPGTTPDVEEPALFDQHAFVRALTHDVQQYNVDNENHLTTNYYDVFQTCYSTKERGKKNLLDRLINPMKTLEAGGEGTDIRPVRRVFTFPSIDYTADTFRSKGFVVLLWVTWILTYFSYLFGSSDALALVQLNCDRTHFWCPILQGITNWLIIGVQLIILGTVFIVWASFGNSIHPTNPLWIVLAMGAVVLFVLLPHFKDFDLEVISSKKKGATDQRLLYRLSATCGFLLLFASLLNLSQRLLPERWFKNTFAAKFCTPGVVRHEADFKQAASYKVNQLVRNACQIHKTAELDGGVSNDVGETKYGRAMLAYARTSDEREEFGGFMWTWKKIYNGELFRDEGVWFTTHLLAGNVAQFFICLILGALFIQFYQSELFQEGLKYLDALPIETHGSERWRLMLPLFFGVIWGEILILVIAANYIPSTVNTILQYRSGGESSLHKKKFLKLRFAVDHSSLLFGSIFWGTLYTSIISGFFAMVALGIILWPDFAVLVLDIFANIIGIGITMFIKWIALIGFRRKYAKAYYRKNVSLTNFVGVILESWVSRVFLQVFVNHVQSTTLSPFH
ncbi:hypothetical protein ACHAWF_016652 [Thalassiosira exigua]